MQTLASFISSVISFNRMFIVFNWKWTDLKWILTVFKWMLIDLNWMLTDLNWILNYLNWMITDLNSIFNWLLCEESPAINNENARYNRNNRAHKRFYWSQATLRGKPPLICSIQITLGYLHCPQHSLICQVQSKQLLLPMNVG